MSNVGRRARRASGGAAASAPISVASSRTDQISNSGTTADIALSGTPAENDVYVVVTSSDGSQPTLGDAAVAAGWTRLFVDGAGDPASVVLLKRMSGSPDSTVPIEGRDDNSVEIIVAQFKNVNTTTALDAALVSASGASGMPNPPSHTTVNAGAMRVITGHLDDDLVTGSLSGWTVLATNGGYSGRNSSVMLGYLIAATAGALDPSAFSGGGDDTWFATHFSLRPS